MKILVAGCTHAGTAAVVNLKELYPESEITIYEKNDNISFFDHTLYQQHHQNQYSS